MGGALYAAAPFLAPWLSPPTSVVLRFAALGALVGGGLVVYALAALALGAVDMRQFRRLMRR